MTWVIILPGVTRATWNHFVEGFHDQRHAEGDKITNILPTPLAGGQERSFAEQQGGATRGWAFNFWHHFQFSMCYPKGAHSLGHRWGQFLTSGAKFNFRLCYRKGVHSLGHRWGQLLRQLLQGLNSIFYCATTRGLIHWVIDIILGSRSEA